ncbi:MAG TPA: CoA-transferase [Actinomycetota bacterium]|nr:CoA-transferase [Actinomycetota bacterium]
MTAPDLRTTIDEAVAELRDDMTIGLGGWGSRRKPMAVVRAIARSGLKDLTIASYGGPDVGLLCAAGKVRKVVFGFVTLDSIPLDPHFRAARESGAVEAREMDEGMFYLSLLATSWRVPFLPTRAGLGSDVMRMNPDLKTLRSPYGDEEVVAVPPLKLDAAFVHLNRGDRRGNAQFLGPDLYFDDLFLSAASRRFVTCERLVETEDLLAVGSVHTMRINRSLVDGIAEAPLGAHFTSCEPDYPVPGRWLKEYAGAAKDPDAWSAYRARFVDVSDDDYRRAVAS